MKYEMPIMEIYMCSDEDIITASGLKAVDEGYGDTVKFSDIDFFSVQQ